MKKTIKVLVIVLIALNLNAQTKFQTSLHFGSGADLRIGNNPLDYDYDLEAPNLGFNMKAPIHLGAGLGVQFKKIGIKTGFDITSRNFVAIHLDQNRNEISKTNLKIRYYQMSVPLSVNFLQPISEKLSLNFGIGGSIDWTGKSDTFRFSGWAPESEDKGTWALVSSQNNETNDILFLVLDRGPGLFGHGFLGLQYKLKENLSVSFRATYKSQIGDVESISYLAAWGYDEENNVRVNGYSPRIINFRTLHFDLGVIYSLLNQK